MPGALEPGSLISHYRVISSLGVGGMGEVYKAHDTNLDRPVALKILPPELVRNDDRVRRFVQEAKSASSLNHPHIVTIHEIGQADLSSGDSRPLHFIAMELIDGSTLKRKIHQEDSDLRTLLVYLSQAAEGLAKAHAAGIIHRDLKPENIMITRDGYAKVLDFGLAKLSIRKGAEGGTDAPTEAREQTREGAVLGTVAYMSPEQVQGKVVDHRSDIFSFGCMLYEAATRRKAFDADSDIDVMHMIVHDKPMSVDEINPNVPAELRRMIRRCLAKDPEKRYQSMKDLAIELADMVEEFDQLSTSTSSRSSASSSISAPSLPPIQRRSTWIIVAAVVVVAAIAVSVVEWRRMHSSAATGALQSMRMQQVTKSGNVTNASISPDGRYVAHVVRDENLAHTLFVRQVATGSDVRLVGPSPNQIFRPTFSPDGNYLYYGHYDRTVGGLASLYRIPTLGGEPRKFLVDIDTAVSFSPDGTQISFGRGELEKGENNIMIARADGTAERVIASYPRLGPLLQTPIAAVWSADGKNLITSVASTEGGLHNELVEIAVSDGAKRVIGRRWFKVWSVELLPDASALVVAAVEDENNRSQLWLQPYPDGQARRITNDLNYYQGVTLTDDGKTIATIKSSLRSRLFAATLTDESSGRPLTPELRDQVITYLSASSTGRIVYAVEFDIWLLEPDGSAKQITTDGMSGAPSISADGTAIAFTSRRNGGVPHIWIMDADGSNARQVTRGDGEDEPTISPDGSWIAFYAIGKGLARAQVSGESMTIVADVGRTARLSISPDGKFIAYDYWREDHRVAVIPSNGGKAILDVYASSGYEIGWTPNGDGVTYRKVSGGATNIWKQPLDGSPARPITNFKSGLLWSYAWLPDGKLVLARREETRDVVLISDFR